MKVHVFVSIQYPMQQPHILLIFPGLFLCDDTFRKVFSQVDPCSSFGILMPPCVSMNTLYACFDRFQHQTPGGLFFFITLTWMGESARCVVGLVSEYDNTPIDHRCLSLAVIMYFYYVKPLILSVHGYTENQFIGVYCGIVPRHHGTTAPRHQKRVPPNPLECARSRHMIIVLAQPH